MLFISRFIKKDQPYVIQIKSDTRRLTGYNLLPPFRFPSIHEFLRQISNYESGIRKYQFKNFFYKKGVCPICRQSNVCTSASFSSSCREVFAQSLPFKVTESIV